MRESKNVLWKPLVRDLDRRFFMCRHRTFPTYNGKKQKSPDTGQYILFTVWQIREYPLRKGGPCRKRRRLPEKKGVLVFMNLDPRNVKRDFLRFVFASVMAQWIFALYSAVDGMFVARGVNETALSAVNIASPYINFLFSVSLLFAVGASTIAAIYLGQGKTEKADQVVSLNLALLILLSVIITAAVLIFPDRVAVFLGATDVTIEYVKQYITMVAPFSVCFIVAYMFEVLVKTDGFPKYATCAIISGCLINCVLDYVLVIRLPFGVAGAAFATGFAQAALVVIYLVHFFGPRATLKLVRFRVDWKEIRRIIKIGIPSGLTEFSAGITIFLFNHAIITYLNEDALVSYTIIGYVNTIVVMGMAGIAQGAQPLISYFFGQGNKDIVGRLLRYSLCAAAVMALAVFAGCITGADFFVSLFVSAKNAALRESSAAVFRIFATSFLIMGFNVVVCGFFTAVEQPVGSLIISLARGLVVIACSIFFMTALFGGAGIWWSATVCELLCFVITSVLFWWHKRSNRLY